MRYRKLHNEDSEDDVDSGLIDDGFTQEQFTTGRIKSKTPWKAIIYAMILFIVGTTLLIAGLLIVTGHIDPVKHNERFWPLVFLGLLMFIPGSYHTYFAYKAFSGDPDWDFEEFPDF